jgi:hypothetical protein
MPSAVQIFLKEDVVLKKCGKCNVAEYCRRSCQVPLLFLSPHLSLKFMVITVVPLDPPQNKLP